MDDPAPTGKSAWHFFILVFMLSVPFWLIGPIIEQFLQTDLPINLPISALMFVAPLLAALILVHRGSGADGMRKLLRRSWDHARIKRKIWYLPIFGLMPMIYLLAYGWMYLSGASLPDHPQFPLAMLPIFILIFFVAGICEELGWSGSTSGERKRWPDFDMLDRLRWLLGRHEQVAHRGRAVTG